MSSYQRRFATSDVTQAKKKGYCDQHPINQFLPLAIKYLNVYINMLMCSYTIVPMPFEASKGLKSFLFLS